MRDLHPSDQHRCRAKGCRTMIPRCRFMCPRHWYLVPKAMRQRLLGTTYTTHQDTRLERYAIILLAAVARRIVKAKEDHDDYRAAVEWVRYNETINLDDLEFQLDVEYPRSRVILSRLIHCQVIDSGDASFVYHNLSRHWRSPSSPSTETKG